MPDYWKPLTQDTEDELRLRDWSNPRPNALRATTDPFRAETQVSAWEKPKEWAEIGMEKFGEAISKVPILPEAFEFVAPAFKWIHEELEQPFAAIITSPFSPDLPWKKGESWIDHQKREYNAWDAPTYVKGAAEFAMPLWWMPWFAWAGVGARALGVGSRATKEIAKSLKMMRVGDKGFLPPSELLDTTLFRAGHLTAAMEGVPIVNRIVKMVGGEGAFITRKEAIRISGLKKAGTKLVAEDALTLTKMELVKMGFLNSMRDGVSRLLVPRLQVLEHGVRGGLPKLLGMDSRGVVGNIVSKSGKSNYFYDVLEGVVKDKSKYKFAEGEAGKLAEKYVDTLTEIMDDIWKLGKQEGIRMPKEKFLHRIVKGKVNPDTGKFEATAFGSFISKSRVHETMKEGVEAAEKIGSRLDYGLDMAESVTSTINHYMTAIVKKRFQKAIHPLGKTIKDKVRESMGKEWDELYNMRILVKAGGTIKDPARFAELAKTEKLIEAKYKQAGQVIGEGLSKFNRHPSFKSKLFPTEIVKTTEKILGDNGQKWLSTMASISGGSRMLVAAMDLSMPFIQGLAVAGRNPAAWAGVVKRNMEFFIKPENLYKYQTRPEIMAIAAERMSLGASGSTFEFFNALLPLQRQLGRIPVAGKPLKGLVRQTYGRAEAAFSGGGEAARNYMWTASRYKALTNGVLDPVKGMEIVRSIDRMTGVMSVEALAIGRTQQDFENAFLFFAPRYTRAGLSFVGDSLRGGMAGAEARKSLAALSAGGLSMYYGVTKVLGQTPNLNPNSGRFMTVKIGDSHIGIGGIMVALMRFGYDVAATAIEDPVNLVKPISEGSINRWDNPFLRFMYARTAPLTSTLYGALVEQADYFGEPFENVGDWANFMADKITPIAVQGLIDDPTVQVGVAEFAGLRAFPKSPWELLDEQRDETSLREYGQPYDNLNDLQQTRIDKSDAVRELQKDVDTQTVTRGDATSVGFLNRQRERDSAREVYEESLWSLEEAYNAGAIDGRGFREGMSDAGYGLGVTYEHIDKQPEYEDVLKTLKEPREIQDKHLVDIAYSEFMSTLYKEGEFEDQFGLFQFDKYNAYIEEFRTKYGEEIYQYVLDMKAERDESLPPLAKEYQKAKEVMKPYWAIQDRVEKMFGMRFSESPKGKSLITKLRQQMRLTNKEISKYYNMFYAQQ